MLEGRWTRERRKVRPTVMVVCAPRLDTLVRFKSTLGMKSILDMMTAVAAAPSLPSSSTLVSGLGSTRRDQRVRRGLT